MDLEKLGFVFILIGFFIVFIAVLIPLFTIAFSDGIKISGGGCIVLLFIPICFGYGEFALQLIVIAIVLAMALILISFIVYRQLFKQLEMKRASYV
jgi:uncharacterized membrane protein